MDKIAEKEEDVFGLDQPAGKRLKRGGTGGKAPVQRGENYTKAAKMLLGEGPCVLSQIVTHPRDANPPHLFHLPVESVLGDTFDEDIREGYAELPDGYAEVAAAEEE